MNDLNLENLKVMVVDDHAPMRRLLMSLLREMGIKNLSQAEDGNEALRKLKEAEPDIIITDAIMEPMDGLEFTKKIRASEADVDPFVPIIMISGQVEVGYILEARDAGINEFLAKPISTKSIFQRIQSIIANPRSFIRAEDFFGPDRRRKSTEIDPSKDRREADNAGVNA